MKQTLIALVTAIVTAGLLNACVEQASVHSQASSVTTASADDLLIVDCMLPGQVRKLGSQLTYLTARRPIQTTGQDCEIRGGEYVAYDRSTYGSALRVWMPLAEQGDPDAQNKIGEIYERGLGGEQDYVQAAVWYRRAAEQGSARAQINLGFLLEKGLGVTKDLTAALAWYRKASKLPDAVMIEKTALESQQAEIASLRRELDQSRAEVERARSELRKREQKLQQERDKLGRRLQGEKTAKLTDAERNRLQESLSKLERQRVELVQRQDRIRVLESDSRQQQERLLLLETEGTSLREQLGLVRTQLQRSQQDLSQYQALTDENERRLAQTRADLAALSSDTDGVAQERIQSLEAQLGEREQRLKEQEQTVAQLQDRTSELSLKLEQTGGVSRADLAAAQEALDEARRELSAARSSASERAQELQQVQNALQAQKANQDTSGIRLAELEAQLQEREKTLAEQQETVQRLRKESDQWRQKLSQLEKRKASAASRTTKAEVPTAPPSIQLIEPPLLAVRGSEENRIPIKRGLKQRSIVGQVTAPAGLFALTMNGIRIAPDTKGLFETDISVTGSETPVNMVAIDKQGKSATLAFSLVTEESAGTLVAKRRNPLEGIDIGGYYALVIGNEKYQHLPTLDTSGNDAKAVAAMLKDKFGYQVTLLLDANRYQILSELNRLRKELSEKDNLLIYYAGHGELDRINLRGHWLPVDAEAHSSANWISNVSLTDILNAMSVRHVLMVADSCYSGALTRSSLSQLDSGQSDDARTYWLKKVSEMSSYTALTSGGLAPVLDGGGGKHSVFAKAFLGVLRDLNEITEGQRVYREVSARVAFEANRYQVEQVPEYAPIKHTKHEGGDYLFVPKVYL